MMSKELDEIIEEIKDSIGKIDDEWEHRKELKVKYGKMFLKEKYDEILNIEGIEKCGLSISFSWSEPRDGQLRLVLELDDEFLESLDGESRKYPIHQTHIFDEIHKITTKIGESGLMIEPCRESDFFHTIIKPKTIDEFEEVVNE